MADNSTYLTKIEGLNKAFTPEKPIEDQAIFAGRIEQLDKCLTAINQDGAHPVLYGERGVGKTSIANIIRIILSSRENKGTVAKKSCDTSDTFESVWTKLFNQIEVPDSIRESMFWVESEGRKRNMYVADGLIDYSADTIVNVLDALPKPVIIILDEFDRRSAEFDNTLFADMLKNISDSYSEITIMIVGVGDSVVEIIGEHVSIGRNLTEIHLPVMTSAELQDVVRKGLRRIGMNMEDRVEKQIVEYSAGYPHYTHLLALHSCKTALFRDAVIVTMTDFDTAVRKAIEGSQESLRTAYQTATLATKDNIYKEVLFACSGAQTDENGTFRATDILPPLSDMMGAPMNVNGVTYHLGKFISAERGNILTTVGKLKRRRYRFTNPLMKAYVRLIMHDVRVKQANATEKPLRPQRNSQNLILPL